MCIHMWMYKGSPPKHFDFLAMAGCSMPHASTATGYKSHSPWKSLAVLGVMGNLPAVDMSDGYYITMKQ